MAKKHRNTKDALKKAKQYSDILLYEATGGTMGKPLSIDAAPREGMTFAEKRGLLDSLVKIAILDHKVNPEEEESVFDTIKRNRDNGDETGGRESGRAADSDDSADDGDSEFA